MNFSKPWLPSDKNVVGNSLVPRKVPTGVESADISPELRSSLTPQAPDHKDLVHFDSAAFSKFFSRSELPAKRDNEVSIRPAQEASDEVSRVLEALKLEEGETSQEKPKGKERLFDSPDFVDDFDSLSRIFSNEKLEKPKVIPFLPNSSQNLAPCLSERTAIRKPSSFYDSQAPMNRFYGSYQAPFYGSPQMSSFVPRTAGRSGDQPESNRSWNTAENHNTSMTTAASHGNLEKVDFMHHRTDSADNNSFGSPFFPSNDQQYHHGQFQAPMMYGFAPLNKNQSARNGQFPMMQMPITEEEVYEGNAYYNHGENSQMQMNSAKHSQMTSFFDARPPQGHFDYHMQQQQQAQQQIAGQHGGKFLPIGGKKGEGKGNIYGKALAQRMKAKYGAGGSGNHEDSGNIFDVDVRRIEWCKKTTLMIKNIPNKYNLPLILEAIDKNHKGKYDFFYLPIDFRNNCNVGYAFINFSDTRFIKDFYEEFNGKKWDKFNSEKICDIKYARIQGRDALIQHFEYSSVMNQADKKLKPVILPKNDLSSIENLVQTQKAAIDENKTALC